MANTSRINGFKVVKHLNGSPYNGQANIYYVPSAADEIFVGDIVKLGGTADSFGIPTVDLAAVGNTPVGVVVGILANKFDPLGKMTHGSIILDLPAVSQIAAAGAGYVLVADSPDIVMEVETSNGTLVAADIGNNISLALGTASRTATAVTSPATVDVATKNTTPTLVFRLMAFKPSIDNDITAASSRVYVGFNVHQFGSVGVTGV